MRILMLREIKEYILMMDTELVPLLPILCPPWETSITLLPTYLPGSIRDRSAWSVSVLAKGMIPTLKGTEFRGAG